jgi:hypothetical protein
MDEVAIVAMGTANDVHTTLSKFADTGRTGPVRLWHQRWVFDVIAVRCLG